MSHVFMSATETEHTESNRRRSLILLLLPRKGKPRSMDFNSEDWENRKTADCRVAYPDGRNNNFPVSRPGNNPGRVKRVVSCKRKTHYPMVARRKPAGTGRTCDAANSENEMKCLQDMPQEKTDLDRWAFALNVNNSHMTGRTGSEQADYHILSELTRDHSSIRDVLYGRHLRLKVSLTLWQRNIGELLTYFLRIQDIGVFVDFLPLISKSIDDNSSRITIGSCVDLLPLVQKVLTSPYEEYLIVGLKWINAVLKNWCDELRSSGCSGSAEPYPDKNYQVFNQQLLDLWHQQSSLKYVPGPAGDMAQVIDSFLSQLY
ncbi:KATNB1-like protein 1 isoform X2 [Brachionichthys hirsutus]|uniref:KATNB1-like protein 1 isoform X2 n=1 Tax=Brachionichthys hirsutus TaxID=412623 RepID=UPI003604B0E5